MKQKLTTTTRTTPAKNRPAGKYTNHNEIRRRGEKKLDPYYFINVWLNSPHSENGGTSNAICGLHYGDDWHTHRVDIQKLAICVAAHMHPNVSTCIKCAENLFKHQSVHFQVVIVTEKYWCSFCDSIPNRFRFYLNDSNLSVLFVRRVHTALRTLKFPCFAIKFYFYTSVKFG